MADEWYGLATVSHFWIRRRFEVLQRLLRRVPIQGNTLAEIGCGHGVLQAQLRTAFGIAADGFDLNLEALNKNQAEEGHLYYYNIHDRHAVFEARYNSLFVFDVLEHIEDEDGFLRSALFHLAKDGVVYVNVPALQVLYSAYDRSLGHIRRYNIAALRRVATLNGLTILDWTYWGLPLVPIALLRKLLLAHAEALDASRRGFDPRNTVLNAIMIAISRCERVPQHLCGTSLMAALTRQPPSGV